MQADRGAASRRARACHYLAGQGVEKIDPGNTGGTLYHKDFDLTFVPAWHSASHMVDGRPIYLGACCGLVVAPKQGKTVYHMGDTAIFSDMALIGEIYGPSIGFVPIGDRYTMGARTAALACKRFFKFETIVPCHYGTFPVLDQTADKFVAEMGARACSCRRLGCRSRRESKLPLIRPGGTASPTNCVPQAQQHRCQSIAPPSAASPISPALPSRRTRRRGSSMS
jgi:L-ascorbate metabolism protein UlaG (beta-lactamase superfamily)